MQNVFELEKTTVVPNGGSYLSSYPFIKSYFQSLNVIAEEDIIRGSHMVYGWMPTILDLYIGDENLSLDQLVFICNQAKNGVLLNKSELESIASVVNNSIVGASKLLHFVNPNVYPIWDSKIYTFVYEKKPYSYRVNDVSLYVEFIDTLSELHNSPDFNFFHDSVNKKIGYDVSPVRALELIMFLNSPSI